MCFIPINCNLRVFQLMRWSESQSQLGNPWEMGNLLHLGSVFPSWRKLQIWWAGREIITLSVTFLLIRRNGNTGQLPYSASLWPTPAKNRQIASTEQTDWIGFTSINHDLRNSKGRWGSLSIMNHFSPAALCIDVMALEVFTSGDIKVSSWKNSS